MDHPHYLCWKRDSFLKFIYIHTNIGKVLLGPSVPSGFHPDNVLCKCITTTAVTGALIKYALMTDIFIALLL